ncbi:MFS transporter [uncultured Alistipes sp.]|jgi:macrolide efflux pump|uniref:MFS transporter n=1 Tax=uncultured Alistipes sp. TaxID=538949 RepID=UPI0025D0DBD5|nr:MFS transporter [uncultured Alistipes sp.]
MESWKRTFAIIWSGQLVSILTSSVVGYAVIFWMSLSTGSAEVLALAAISGMLPQSLLGPVVGIYVDRWDRKRTMILSDSFIALCTLVLAVLFWLDIAQMWHIYILLACRSIGSAFHTPSMQASVPLLAPEEQLTRVAGINQIINSLSNIVGPAVGALLITLTGIGNILLLDVAGAIVACTSLLFVRIPNPEKSLLKPDLWREFREGIGAITAIPGMALFFTLTILVFFFLVPVGVMFPLMTLQHFGGGAYEMSLIEIVWGGGALIGGAIMSARIYRVNRIVLINLMNLLIGVSFAVSGMLPPGAFAVFVLLSCIEGIAGGVFNASFVSVIQSRIDAGVLGRVMSLYYSFGLLPSALGLLGTGFLAEHVGLTNAFVISGSIICTLGLIAFLIPSVMRLDKQEPK